MSCVISSRRSQSQHIAAEASQKFNMCDFFASTQAFVAKAGIVCEWWCSYIERHRVPLYVLLTHVWKPVFKECLIGGIVIVLNKKISVSTFPLIDWSTDAQIVNIIFITDYHFWSALWELLPFCVLYGSCALCESCV